MIPESAGATPYGIFLLADDYLRAARFTAVDARLSSKGPVRLLSYHAAELFLKTYLRSAGETIEDMRAHGHNIASMLGRAQELSFKIPPQIVAQAEKMNCKKDYLRVRYVVVDERSDISVEIVLRFADTIRASVVAALDLNEYGAPEGKHWLGELPTDYPNG